MKEIWKPIKGYEGIYEVSNLGAIRSYYAKGNHSLSDKPSIKNISTIKGGKNYIHLFKDGKEVCVSVSRLVAGTFLDKPSNATRVKHLDGNVANNRVDNLVWLTK